MIFIYIYDTDDVIDEKIRTCFIKKIHIVNDLKINILIDNDIDDSENIIIFIEDCIAHIDNCDVIIFLKVKIIETVVAKSIHLRKITMISFKTKLSMKIHHLIVLNKEYLFESKKIFNFTAYAHLMNEFIKTILLHNEFDIFIQISRNHRLKRITKMNYFNAFHIIDDNNEKKIRDLIVKRSQSFKQKNWFKTTMTEIIIIFVAIASTSLQKPFANTVISMNLQSFAIKISKTVLPNEVIIYNSNDVSMINNLSQMINAFSNL